jgi:protease II
MKEKKLMKQQEVLGGYNPDDYITERLYATATDETKIPISLVYQKGFKKDGNAPLLLYAYGSYGASMDASFNSARLSLLNRGFAFAIAHIRGGQEMGRQWYEDGKMMKKKNTFTDFINCGEYLIKEKYTSKDHLYANGGSAGGLLMGAIVNMAPDLWRGVIAAVPFVDVIVFWADLVPTASHLPYPWIMGYDLYPVTTLENKKRWLPRAAEEGWLAIFEHDPEVPVARLAAERPGRYRAEPLAVAAGA